MLPKNSSSGVHLTPKLQWFEAACLYAQTQIEIRKAQGNTCFDDLTGVDAILEIAMEIDKKLPKAKFNAPEHLNLPDNKY
jgi:hypothetical protein